MIASEDFVRILKNNRFDFFTGVPCSFFQSAINCVLSDASLRYLMVPNEGSALALASGAYLGGRRPVVMIQNSGFGNLINPLTSLSMIYQLPVLIFMSGRAYGVEDEPQHEIMGKIMPRMLEAMDVSYEDMPQETLAFEETLKKAVRRMEEARQPFFFLVRKGTLSEYLLNREKSAAYPMKRIDAIGVISQIMRGDDSIIATTGMPSRELFSLADRRENFYMQGSMGHAAAIGLGAALARPDKKIVVLDGDGALLMHMGILSSIGHYKPKNLYHVVLDNESYETTGDQDTTSATTNMAQVAAASGYLRYEEVLDEANLKRALGRMLQNDGPAFLRVKINRLPTSGIPRISTKYTSAQIAANFKKQFAES